MQSGVQVSRTAAALELDLCVEGSSAADPAKGRLASRKPTTPHTALSYALPQPSHRAIS